MLSRLQWSWPTCVLTYIVFVSIGVGTALFYASLQLVLIAVLASIFFGAMFPSCFTCLHYISTTLTVLGARRDTDGSVRRDCHRAPEHKWSPPQTWSIPNLIQEINLSFIKDTLREKLMPLMPKLPKNNNPNAKEDEEEIAIEQRIKEIEEGYRKDVQHFNDNLDIVFKECATLRCYIHWHMSVIGPAPMEFNGKHYPFSYSLLLAPGGYTSFSKFRDHFLYGKFYYTDVIQYHMFNVDTNYGEIPVFFEVPRQLLTYEELTRYIGNISESITYLYAFIEEKRPELESIPILQQEVALKSQLLQNANELLGNMKLEFEGALTKRDLAHPLELLTRPTLFPPDMLGTPYITHTSKQEEQEKKPSIWTRIWNKIRRKKPEQ